MEDIENCPIFFSYRFLDYFYLNKFLISMVCLVCKRLFYFSVLASETDDIYFPSFDFAYLNIFWPYLTGESALLLSFIIGELTELIIFLLDLSFFSLF